MFVPPVSTEGRPCTCVCDDDRAAVSEILSEWHSNISSIEEDLVSCTKVNGGCLEGDLRQG